jgi:hypothetical protein
MSGKEFVLAVLAAFLGGVGTLVAVAFYNTRIAPAYGWAAA